MIGRARLDVTAFFLPLSLGAMVSLGACRSQPPDPAQGTQKPTVSPAPSAAALATPDASVPEGKAEVDAGTPEVPLEGAQFTKQVQAAFRVAACGGDDTLIPSHVEKKVVDAHCNLLKASYAEYRKEWLDVAVPFLAKLRPANLPTTVVYPFGGGDLVSALATYPDATELTTMSLEMAGDVRAIDKADNRRLVTELSQLRDHLGKLFLKAHSRTINLDIETRGAIPGEVAYTMAALAIHGYEPVTIRYFAFNPDGTLRWLTEEDISKNKADGRAGPFANAEIRFKKPGDTKVRILRHVAYDLSDASLKKSPGLLKHLEAKGKVSTMTKAASHLLWDDANFGVIRDYLMTHTDWMISDTTGVPPRVAAKNGFIRTSTVRTSGRSPLAPSTMPTRRRSMSSSRRRPPSRSATATRTTRATGTSSSRANPTWSRSRPVTRAWAWARGLPRCGNPASCGGPAHTVSTPVRAYCS